MAKVHEHLLDGEVESAGVYAEMTDREIIKIVKLVSITRTPDTLIAQINLNVGGKVRDIAIDEPTVLALKGVFDDFRRKHPDGKAPKAPPGTFASQKDQGEDDA